LYVYNVYRKDDNDFMIKWVWAWWSGK